MRKQIPVIEHDGGKTTVEIESTGDILTHLIEEARRDGEPETARATPTRRAASVETSSGPQSRRRRRPFSHD